MPFKPFTVSVCFHAQALSNDPTGEVAHSLHYPIDVSTTIVSQFSLVSYTTSHMLEGEAIFATAYRAFPGFGISFTNDVSASPPCLVAMKRRGKRRSGGGGGRRRGPNAHGKPIEKGANPKFNSEWGWSVARLGGGGSLGRGVRGGETGDLCRNL